MSNVDEGEEFPGRLLHQAALWDNAELLEDLLHGEQIKYLNCQDAWGRTALHAAATTDGSQCLRILLQAGSEINQKCGPRADERTCLHVAAEHGAVENVANLLSYGADILAKDTHGLTALDIAEQADHESCMNVLKRAADARLSEREERYHALRESCSKGEVVKVKNILISLKDEAPTVVNSVSNMSSSLLFTACEKGNKDLVRVLVDFKADGRIHPVTKYSPLYIACYYGRKDIAEIIINRFPELVGIATVEKWLPIHACIINGHAALLELLLRYNYPLHVMKKYLSPCGQYEYIMPFDINSRDVTGQTPLYLACYVGNQKIVDTLLRYKVPAKSIKTSENDSKILKHHPSNSEHNLKANPDKSSEIRSNVHIPESSDLDQGVDHLNCGSIEFEPGLNGSNSVCAQYSPTKNRISGGIHTLMTKLNLVRGEGASGESLISPINVDLYCNNNTETALHVSVKNKHHNIASMLLSYGANTNLRMYLPMTEYESMKPGDDYEFTGSTALVEACRNRDLGMIDLLLRNKCRDDEGKALYIAAHNNDELIVSKLLTLRAHIDPEYKVNKRAFEIRPNQQLTCLSNVSSAGVYSSLFPTVPVMINWHGQRCLSYLKNRWFIDAAVSLNPKLKLSPKNQGVAVYAITRLDISNNALTQLPEIIFQLPSLRILNASQNKLSVLPAMIGLPLMDGTVTLPRKNRKGVFQNPISVIEEIHLKDNRLVSLPDGLFDLPVLQYLDVSNNKLVSLPFKMWTAPKLRELNASFNLLRNLSIHPEEFCTENQTNFDLYLEQSEEDSLPSFEADENANTGLNLSKSKLETCETRHLSQGEYNIGQSPQNQVRSRNVLTLDKHGSVITCSRLKEVTHHSLWSATLQVQEFFSLPENSESCGYSQLQSLNLSHNNFSTVPQGLACLGLHLNRLYLAYNRISEIGPANLYPLCLKQLDLSHNKIASWNSIAKVGSLENLEIIGSLGPCLGVDFLKKSGYPKQTTSTLVSKSPRSSIASTVSSISQCCPHRRHTRLENLRTLILADNLLTRMAVYVDSPDTIELEDDDNLAPCFLVKPKLLFPCLSMLDISNNNLKEIPSNIHEYSNLSVLKVSGNCDVAELPPEMGLLSRLWNLNTRGCSLQDPLKSMIDSKKYKTMDIIGYLRSILEDARPYARMKLMVVGVQGIGKTSLIEQLRVEGSSRKKQVDHWAKRMGSRSMGVRTSRGAPMSTVGVDIGDWVYEKKVRGQSNHGPVFFRTWDFGGQKEYYATHQYFLSKRSLYLVVWNICDGEEGVSEILQWLVNIQARAPNAPVLIIGTHYDLVREKFPPSWSEDLQQLIRNRFINVIDADKLGLPRVLDTIEISCRTRHNIKLLCSLIYDTVFSLKTPGSKERLLEQKIPASYLALEDVIRILATDRRAHGLDPVLPMERYQSLVTHEMSARGYKPFRDISELNQATSFLHENGVLLHYEDVTLKDLYFLDPQWLCDMLAHVVTIREINPFVKSGLMKLEDLKHVFKSSSSAPVDAKSYIVSLLNKFEVGLTWDNRNLLIPSLLPSEDQIFNSKEYGNSVPVRCRGGRGLQSRKFSHSTPSHQISSSPLIVHGTKQSVNIENSKFSESSTNTIKLYTKVDCNENLDSETSTKDSKSEKVILKENDNLDNRYSCDSDLNFNLVREKKCSQDEISDLGLSAKLSQYIGEDNKSTNLEHSPKVFQNKNEENSECEIPISGDTKLIPEISADITDLEPSKTSQNKNTEDLGSNFSQGRDTELVLRSKTVSNSKVDNYTESLSNVIDEIVLGNSENLPTNPLYVKSFPRRPILHINHRSSAESAVRRLLLMSYFPSGFWSRLIARILGDDCIGDVVKNYFSIPEEFSADGELEEIFSGAGEWKCWQTGLELRSAGTTLLRLREVIPLPGDKNVPKRNPLCGSLERNCSHLNKIFQTPRYHESPDYKSMKFLIKQDGNWCDLEIKNCAVMEILLPNEAIELRKKYVEQCWIKSDLTPGVQSIVIDPSSDCLAKLLAITVDHIDTLLEDWYPTLGTRFIHTSEGRFLVTRLIPCPRCLLCHGQNEVMSNHPQAGLLPDNWGSFVELNPLYCSMTSSALAESLRGSTSGIPSTSKAVPIPLSGFSNFPNQSHKISKNIEYDTAHEVRANVNSPDRRSWDSSTSDRDSGVGPDSASSSRNPSCEGRPDLHPRFSENELTPVVYSFMVEECILSAHDAPTVNCPLHGVILLAKISPDVIFLDLGNEHLVHTDAIKQGKLLGRGGFGFVFEGSYRLNNGAAPLNVALKMLQPVHPGVNAKPSAVSAFNAAQTKWNRDSLQYATKAYCCARQEVNILLSLHHPNIVPFVGVCPRPLAIVLALAPRGSLDQCLRNYRRSGTKFELYCLQQLVLQVAKALEYLHGQHIIYRDLKSENVLVWELPFPSQKDSIKVHVKLADYGISRLTMPTGAKGFGGTEGFMAPEIMRHNGEEEYTDKVDCFSFGMFLYELFTTHQPYENCDNVKEQLLEGGRPSLTQKETEYPLYVLDLMVLCWSQNPRYRPSASQVVSIGTAPEFTHLLDVISLENSSNFVAAGSVCEFIPTFGLEDEFESQAVSPGTIWLSHSSTQLDLLKTGSWRWDNCTSIEGFPEVVTAICQVRNYVWLGDQASMVHGYEIDGRHWVFSYCMESETSPSGVILINFLENLDRVCVALNNGRIFLCSSSSSPSGNTSGEGSFILTEVAAASPRVLSMAYLKLEKHSELWCGGDNFVITVFRLHQDGSVTDQEEILHFTSTNKNQESDRTLFLTNRDYEKMDQVLSNQNLEPENSVQVSSNDYKEPHEVTLLCTSSGYDQDDSLRQSVWSHLRPGSVVFHWDASTKKIINRLDCSKLVPCSESFKSISMEENWCPSQCQITAMSIVENNLLIGTSWGCIIVADACSLSPITVFRPFSGEVLAILPLFGPYENDNLPSDVRKDVPIVSPTKKDSGVLPQKNSSFPLNKLSPQSKNFYEKFSFVGKETLEKSTPSKTEETPTEPRSPLVATIGKGYRNLLSRYAPTSFAGATLPPHLLNSECGDSDDTLFCLLWKSHTWLNP